MPQIKCLDERVLPNDAACTSGHVLVLPASNANPHQRDAMSDRRAEQGEIPPRGSEQRKNCCGDRELAKARPGWPGRLSSTELNDIIVHLRFLLAPQHTLFRASNSKCQKEKGAQSFTKRPFFAGQDPAQSAGLQVALGFAQNACHDEVTTRVVWPML